MRARGFESTTAEVLEGVDLSGRLALITGGSSGLGAETARALSAAGAAVVLTARDLSKAEKVAAEIRESTGNPAVEVEALELGSGSSVRAFAQRFAERHPALHILVNNAGVMACPEARTPDGHELQFGTNHVGHFLLTGLLLPLLRAGAPARVVALSSRGHQLSPVVFEDLHFDERAYDKWLAYGQSKTANVLFAVELDRRLASEGVRAFAVHPGVILTELGRHLVAEDLDVLRARQPGAKLRFKPVEAGAATSVYAATAAELEGEGGRYLEDCGLAAIDDSEGSAGVRSYAVDAAAAKRLWEVSETLVGERFGLAPGSA